MRRHAVGHRVQLVVRDRARIGGSREHKHDLIGALLDYPEGDGSGNGDTEGALQCRRGIGGEAFKDAAGWLPAVRQSPRLASVAAALTLKVATAETADDCVEFLLAQ